VRLEITALLNWLVAATMTLYIRMGLKTVIASAKTGIFGRIMLTK
jgi:hypothetical protein